jgi:hypothetical protein
MMISESVIKTSPLPISQSKLLDFDQLTAFITTGIIPLLFSIYDAFNENAETFAQWWPMVKERFKEKADTHLGELLA